MDIIAKKRLETTSQIYYCLVKSVSDNKCTIKFNNKQYVVPYYGGAPVSNKTYALFIPQNNMSQAFVIGEEGTKINDNNVSSISTWSSQKIRDFTYPVGSIYMSVSSTSPATLFGGTWQQIEDTFLLSAGSTYTAGDTGGEAAHTLTVDEIPAHSHVQGKKYSTALGAYSPDAPWTANSGTIYNWPTGDTGGDQAHNNMPPYLVVYMWKRTA